MEQRSAFELNDILISPQATIREAIVALTASTGIVLIVDNEQRLLGGVKDDEIRHAILAGHDLDAPVSELETYQAEKKPIITAQLGADRHVLLQLMRDRQIHQIPVVDSENRVVDLIQLQDLLSMNVLPIVAVVYEDSLGIKFHPGIGTTKLSMTTVPILEWLVKDLGYSGINKLFIVSNIMPRVMRLAPRQEPGTNVSIDYVQHNQPLDIAGNLNKISDWREGLLVISGNILSLIDYGVMFLFHKTQHADITIATCEYHLTSTEAHSFFRMDDSGAMSQAESILHINTGIYFLSPSVKTYIQDHKNVNISNLIELLVEAKLKIVSFPVGEYWFDAEQLARYEAAPGKDSTN